MLTVPSTSFHHSYNQAEPLYTCPRPIYTPCPPTTLTTTQNPSMPTHDPSMPHSTQSRLPAPNPTRQHLLQLLGTPQRLPVTPLYLSMPNPTHHHLFQPRGTPVSPLTTTRSPSKPTIASYNHVGPLYHLLQPRGA